MRLLPPLAVAATLCALLVSAPAQAAPSPSATPVVTASAPTAAAPTPRANTFPERFSVNAAGDLEITGNTLLTCNAKVTGCTNAQGTNKSGGKLLNNNDYDMTMVDVDSDPTTVNSSSAALDIPANSPILFAGLYWSAGASGNQASGKPPAGADFVKLKLPGDLGYTTLKATQYWTVGSTNKTYSAMANVTELIKRTGRGNYTVGDVKADLGYNHFAGWSLIVVYADATQPVRAMTVYDGLVSVESNKSAIIDVSGFRTPPTGVVRTELGVVAYEGDLNLTGDQLKLNGTALGDSERPTNNFFNSAITTQDGQLSDKNPDYRNQLGFDTGVVAPAGLIKNGATSAQFTATSSGDQYYPAALTFSTELYSPRFNAQKAVSDLDGEPTRPGHTLQYTLTATNNAEPTTGDASVGTVITDPWPLGATYVPGSVRVNGKPVPDSGGIVTIGADALTVRVGTGASATQGGRLNVGDSVIVTYEMSVNANAAGTDVVNGFKITGRGATTDVPAEGLSPQTITPVIADQAGLSIRKTAVDQDPSVQGATFIAGRQATWRISVKNTGSGTAESVVVDDTLPAGFEYTSALGDGWSCAAQDRNLICTRPQLLAGATAPDITVIGAIPADAANGSTMTNTAHVSSDTPDPNPDGKTSTSTPNIERLADLAITKKHEGSPIPGQEFTYQLSVRQNGPSTASNVSVTDVLPTGLTLVSATGPGWTCTGTGTIVCTSDSDLPPGTSAQDITVVTQLTDQVGTTVRNTATVTGAEKDPDPSNNSSTDISDGERYVDLVESVTHTGTAVAGGPAVPVTVSALNVGPSAVPGGSVITQRITIPEGTTYSGYSGGSWLCIPAAASGPAALECTQTLATNWSAGERIDDLVLQVAVNAGETDAKTVTASISTTAAVIETDPENNHASDILTVNTNADLSITTSSSADLIAGGDGQSLEFTVTNNGPSTDPGPFTVHFSALPGLTLVPVLGNPWSCTLAEDHFVCVWNGTLSIGESAPPIVFHVSAKDPGMEPTSTELIGVVRSPAPDPNPDNDWAAAPITVRPFANLVPTKSVSPTRLTAGDPVTFTLTVTNQGPSDARGVSLVDDFGRLGLTVTSWKVVEGSFDCSRSTTLLISCSADRLPYNERGVVTVTAETPVTWSDAGHKVVNELVISSRTRDGDTPSATTEFETDPFSRLTIAKSVEGKKSGDEIMPGAPVTYLLRVTNQGPTDASGATVTDTLPDMLTPVVATGEGWDCTITEQTVTCQTAGYLQSGTSAGVIKVDTIVSPDGHGTLVNTATVTPTSPGDGSSDTTSNRVQDEVDLAISHYGATQVNSGQDWPTTVVVNNNGPAREKGPIVVVIDQTGATPFSAEGDGWKCTISGSKVRCVADRPLAAGETLPAISLVSHTPRDGTSAFSTAEVSGESPESDPSNNTSETTVILVRKADLAITKTLDQVNVVAGQSAAFTFTVTNNGPGTAADPIVSDLLPAGMSFERSKSDPRCANESGAVTCSGLTSLDVGESISFSISAKVASNAIGKRTNTAKVTSSQPDPDPSNNSDSVTFTIIQTITPQVPLIEPTPTIKDRGVTPIYRDKVPTNAGQIARVKVTCEPLVYANRAVPRGDVSPCRHFGNRGGGVDIVTPGTSALRITVTVTAPEVPGYTAMRVVYTYTTKAKKGAF